MILKENVTKIYGGRHLIIFRTFLPTNYRPTSCYFQAGLNLRMILYLVMMSMKQ